MPPRLAHPSLELLKLTTAYTDKLNSIAKGEPLRLCKPYSSEFRAAIRRTAPRFIPRLAEQPRATSPSSPMLSHPDKEGTETLFSGSSSPNPDDFDEQHSATEPDGNASEYSEDSDNDGRPEPRAKYG